MNKKREYHSIMKSHSLHFFCCLLPLTAAASWIQANVSVDEDDQFNYFFLDDTYEMNQEELRASDEPDAVASAAKELGIPELLQNARLYKSTNRGNQRFPLDLPLLTYHTSKRGVTFTPFYNHTHNVFLTPSGLLAPDYINLKSASFTSYINFELAQSFAQELLPAVIDSLDDKLQDVYGDICTIQLPPMFSLFEPLEIQQRQTGSMLGFHLPCNKINFDAYVPFYYVQRNFFMNEHDKAALNNSDFFTTLNKYFPQDPSEADAFLKRHFVNDLFGFGDLRTIFTIPLFTHEKAKLSAGVEFTLPTNIIVKKRFMGIPYDEFPDQPHFSIFDTVNKLICAQLDKDGALKEITKFTTGALDRLTRIAGDVQLGRTQVGVGAQFELTLMPDNCLSFSHALRFQYFSSAQEVRFFRRTVGSEFNRAYDSTDDLEFLSERLTNELYPTAKQVKVQPGAMIEYTPSLHFDWDRWQLHLGYNIWHQTQERITNLDDNPYDLDKFDINAAISNAATQHKLFASITWTKQYCNHIWHIGLGGDGTFAQSGIGYDWTMIGSIGLTF